MSRFLSVRHCLLAALLLAATTATAGERVTFSNPLLPSGADPWIARDGNTWYFMATLGDRLAIRKTDDLTRLAQAPAVTVWQPPAQGANAHMIWAPELHRIDGIWYIYYSATASGHEDDAHRGVFVLENPAADPTTGTWTDRGRLATRWPGIDGTTFAHAGQRYFVYSPYVGADSVLSIVAMADPVTLTGEETIIARPDQDWEQQGERQIVEGPQFLEGPDGDLFLSRVLVGRLRHRPHQGGGGQRSAGCGGVGETSAAHPRHRRATARVCARPQRVFRFARWQRNLDCLPRQSGAWPGLRQRSCATHPAGALDCGRCAVDRAASRTNGCTGCAARCAVTASSPRWRR